jgi:adenine deaminase
MAFAVTYLAELGGGIVAGGRPRARRVPASVAGLLSEAPLDTVIARAARATKRQPSWLVGSTPFLTVVPRSR